METHVKVLGTLQIAFGVLGVVAALIVALVIGGAASIVGMSGDPDAAFAGSIIGLSGVAVVVLLVVLSIPGLIIGIGLVKMRPWARIAGIVLSVLSLAMIPFGTLVGIYGLWVLFSKETERLFTPTAAA